LALPRLSAPPFLEVILEMKIYVASKSRHAPFWRALRSAGVAITSSWIDATLNEAGADPPSDDVWSRHWKMCCDEAAAADVCLFVHFEGEQACGQLIEAGCSLAAGKRVFVVSPNVWWSFANHERCRTFASLEHAIEAIMAAGAASS
jgi:hypothetical protein